MNKIIKRLIQIIFIFIITLLITGHSNAVDEMTSNYYKIDSVKNIISRIEPETTIEVFKSKIKGNNIQIFQDENCTNEITTGNIGTNQFLKSGEKVYKLSVVGDFDGDGKAIQIELTNIIRHIVGLKDAKLDGIYYESADLTGDGLIDQRDVTKYINYIVHGELDLGKKDETAPEVEIKVLEKSTNKIKIKSIGTDRETGIDSNVTYTYYIKKASEPDTVYVKKYSSTEEEYEFDNLESNQTYTIKAEIPDRAGNIGKVELDVRTEVIPNPNTQQGVLTFGNVTWNNGKASVKIGTNTNCIIEYQVNNTTGTWTKGTSEGANVTVSNLEHNDVIYARLTDGVNSGNHTIFTIKDTEKPTATITTENTTSEITATASATDNESGIASTATYAFYIKKSSEPDTSYVQKQNTTAKTYKFTGLTANETYTIKVVVKDIAGNEEVQTKQVTTTNIPDADTQQGAITFGNVTWSNGKASVKISTDTDYTIEYQVGSVDGTWTKGTSAGADVTALNLEHDDVVYARLTDGVNSGNHTIFTIKDTEKPTATITTENTTSEITATASATDNESGINSTATYAFYIKKLNEPDTAYVLKQNTTSNTYTFTGLTANETYTIKVVVNDIAGNEEVQTKQVTTTNIPDADTQQGTITFGDVEWSNGKASVEISTNTSYTIEYQVNSSTGSWTKATSAGASVTVSNLSHNNAVYARLTDGTNAGNYTSITIADNKEPTVTISTQNTTSEIEATASATDDESGIDSTATYGFYIKKSSEADTEYVLKQNTTSNEYSFTGLTANEEYTIKVVIKDIAGNEGVQTKQVTTTNMPDADTQQGTITFGNVTWSNGKASVEISTNTSYTIEYQVNSSTGSWTKATSAGASVTVSNLSHNNAVYARLTDGTNAGNHASLTIADTTEPENATITLSGTSTTTESSVTAQVTLSDNQSGVSVTNSKWVYTTTSAALGTNASSYTNSFTTNPQTLTLSATTDGTYYLHILTQDNVGNKKETISSAITVKAKAMLMVDTVEVGDYVMYDSGLKGEILCRVLYNDPTVDENGYTLGTQLITDNPVTYVEWSGLDYDTVKTFYEPNDTSPTSAAGFKGLMNNETDDYINVDYVLDARNVGAFPQVFEDSFILRNERNMVSGNYYGIDRNISVGTEEMFSDESGFLDYDTLKALNALKISVANWSYGFSSAISTTRVVDDSEADNGRGYTSFNYRFTKNRLVGRGFIL